MYGTDLENEILRPGKKKKGLLFKLLAVILCGILFGASAAAAFFGINAMTKSDAALISLTASESGQTARQSAIRLSAVSYSAGESSLSQSLDVSDVAEGMMPAMVSITNVGVQEVQSSFGTFGRGQTRTQETQSSGSGIIIGENGSELLIVTNNHVIEDATTLSVCFVDDEVCEATVKGTDPDNDLAVIAVNLSAVKDETASAIRVAVLGNSDQLKVGQQVVAIGNALGYGQSVTTGIVSALGRKIDTADATMIQTDAAINPGISAACATMSTTTASIWRYAPTSCMRSG